MAPTDAFVLKQVDDGGDVGGNLIEIIIVHAKILTADGRHIVGLAGVGHSTVNQSGRRFSGRVEAIHTQVIGERDAFLCQSG